MTLEREAGKDQITMLFDNPKGMDFTLKPLKNFRCGDHRVIRSEIGMKEGQGRVDLVDWW